MEKKHCHDCGVYVGEIHKLGCDMEICPFCLNQLLSCSCVYNILNIDCSEGSWTYCNGLTTEQETLWLEKLEQKKRIPYFVIPNLCRLCGTKWPNLFRVSDKEWYSIVPPNLHLEIICRDCYSEIKELNRDNYRIRV
jgi:hypothetical protein